MQENVQQIVFQLWVPAVQHGVELGFEERILPADYDALLRCLHSQLFLRNEPHLKVLVCVAVRYEHRVRLVLRVQRTLVCNKNSL